MGLRAGDRQYPRALVRTFHLAGRPRRLLDGCPSNRLMESARMHIYYDILKHLRNTISSAARSKLNDDDMPFFFNHQMPTLNCQHWLNVQTNRSAYLPVPRR